MTKPIPDRYHTLMPGLFVQGGLAAIEFYQRAPGAEVVSEFTVGDKVLLADLRVGESVFQVTDVLPGFEVAAPDASRGDSAAILIWTEDVDAWHARAVEAGAEVVNRPEKRFHGFYSGAVRDPFGHRWAFVKQVEEVPEAEFRKRAAEALAAMAGPANLGADRAEGGSRDTAFEGAAGLVDRAVADVRAIGRIPGGSQ